MMRWIILSGSFMYRIFLIFGPLGSSSFECAPDIQKAEVNGKIKIICALIPEFTEVKKHVVWNLNDSTILHYNQTGSLFECTSQRRLVPFALNKTEIALTIGDVQMSDFGFYQCFVSIGEIMKDCSINLQPMLPSTAYSTMATNNNNAARSPRFHILPFALVIVVCGIAFIIALIYQRKKRRASGNLLGEDQTQSHPEDTSMLA